MTSDSPELLQAPEVCCVVLDVLHLHPDHCAGWAAVVVVIWVADREEVCREGGIERVGQQNELEGNFLLELDRDRVCLLQLETN